MGQIGQAMQNPNTMAPDPTGFSGSEWAARLMGKGAQGLGQGLQSYTQQNAALRRQPGMNPQGNNINFYGQGSS